MGSCISMHKDTAKLRLPIGSKNGEILIASPVKEKPGGVNDGCLMAGDVAIKSQWSSASIRNEDSDFEDDFFSVNGDFTSRTPSRGTTPVHHSFHLPELHVNKPPIVQEIDNNTSDPEQPSPLGKKKRLSELFKESLRGDEQQYAELTALAYQNERASNATNGTPPYLSGANSVTSSERTPNRGPKGVNKSSKAAQCCLPGLLSNRSFNERRKSMSPAPAVG